MTKYLHVAVGVVVQDNTVLIALRDPKSHQGGLWEFPGGKVEEGESVQAALSRELLEEIGIHCKSMSPLLEIKHDYPDKSVFLDIWWVKAFDGEAKGNEGQPIKWLPVSALRTHDFPEANKPILEAIEKAF